VLRSSGSLALAFSRLDTAEHYFLRAIELDPLSAAGYHYLGLVYQMGGRLDEAERALRRALEILPQRTTTLAVLSLTLLALGRGEAALAAAALEPEGVYRLFAQAIIYHALGHHADSDAAILELSERYADGGAYQIAEAHAARGEVDRAFEWLERAHATRDSGLTLMKSDLHLRSLRDDPRYDLMLKRIGLEEGVPGRDPHP
jgi:tetratricopeptide (TPR) repeat protein